MRRWLGLSLVFLCGCGTTGPESQARELQLQRERWSARGVHSYTFEFTQFGAWFPPNPVRIEVRDDAVASVTRISTGEVLDAAAAARLPTVDSLFNFAQRYLQDGQWVVQLEFDPLLAYPTKISGDIPNAADAAFEYVSRNLRQP